MTQVEITTVLKQLIDGKINQQRAVDMLGLANADQLTALLAEHQKNQNTAEKAQPSAVNIAEFFNNG